MKKYLLPLMALTFSVNIFASTAYDVFPGMGSILRKTAPILGTTCEVNFHNNGDGTISRVGKDSIIFEISDDKFIKKIQRELRASESSFSRNHEGKKSLRFYLKQNSQVEKWDHLNQYLLRPLKLQDGTIDLAFRLEKIGSDQYRVKDFYLTSGKTYSLKCDH